MTEPSATEKKQLRDIATPDVDLDEQNLGGKDDPYMEFNANVGVGLPGERPADLDYKVWSKAGPDDFANDIINGDKINHPNHYMWLKKKAGIEVIDITRWLDFDLGNAVKYILRAGRKGPIIEDLEKAIWYLQDKIKMLKDDKYQKL